MGVVFINYRAKDNPLGAAGIHDMLARRFGIDRVFRDSVSMAAGEHYPTKLREGLEQADVLVAVIGPRWNTITDEQGRLLIQRDRDWVRWEIARAIERGIPIVPVLLRGTPEDAMPPDPVILPASIRKLAEYQTFEVSQRRFGEDLDRLASRLAELIPSMGTLARGSSAAMTVVDRPTVLDAASIGQSVRSGYLEQVKRRNPLGDGTARQAAQGARIRSASQASGTQTGVDLKLTPARGAPGLPAPASPRFPPPYTRSKRVPRGKKLSPKAAAAIFAAVVALLVIMQLTTHDNSGGSVTYLTNNQPGCNSAEGVLVSPTVNFWEASGDQSVSSNLKATASDATSSAVRSAIERLADDYQEFAAAKYSTGQNVGGTSQQVNQLNQEILYDTNTLDNVCGLHY